MAAGYGADRSSAAGTAGSGGFSQWAQGSGNVQVGYVGPGGTVQVTINQAPPVRLPLLRALVPIPTTVKSPARLLRARAGVVPFVDRSGLAAQLMAWLARPEGFASYLVGGRGGSGKTRLGVHLCQQAETQGWVCGLLTDKVDQAEATELARLEARRLIVVDYAETRTEQLQVLLPYLAAHGDPRWPVRVLMLIRAAPTLGKGWEAPLRAAGSDELDVILDETPVQVLNDSPLTTPERDELFDAAARSFASRRAIGADDSNGAVTDPAARASVSLQGEVFASPLLVSVAAYLVVHDPRPKVSPVATVRRELLGGLIGHEDTYWSGSAATLGVAVAARLRARSVALATLAGAATRGEAAELLKLLPEFADASAERRYAVADWLTCLYPGPSWWNPVEPDLLGEYLVAAHLTDDPGVLSGVLDRDDPASVVGPLELYARAVVNSEALRAAVGPVLEGRLPGLCQAAIQQTLEHFDLALLLGGTTLASALTSLLRVIDLPTPALEAAVDLFPIGANQVLGQLTLQLALMLTAHHRRRWEQDPAAHAPKFAIALHNLSIRLGEAGQREDGLAASQEAVDICRGLARDNPPAYTPHLATVLDNLSNQLGATGRRQEGLAASQEAVKIYRGLARDNAAAHAHQLARALSNFSVRLGEAGRWEDGLAASQEAVETYRGLAPDNPTAAYTLHFANALNTLSNRLGEAGQREQGLAAIRESVEIRRGLARDNPAAHAPDLALALNNLSNRLAEAGKPEQGLAAIEESVETYRGLARDNPTAYAPDLANALNNLSYQLGGVGQHQEGLAASQESIEIHRGLARDNPTADAPDLANALNNLSSRLAEAGQLEQGLAAIEESVETLRGLARDNPTAAYAHNLAMALNNLSYQLGGVGRRQEGLAASQESVEIYRGLARDNPRAHVRGLAKVLSNLSNQLADAGQLEQGLAAIEESTEILRREIEFLREVGRG